MLKRPRECPTNTPIPKKAKYDNEMMCDDAQPTQAVLLHAFHEPTQINRQDLSQMCTEQYEEIQYIQQNWTPEIWARAGGDYFKQKAETLTNIATSFSEFQEREYFLNFMNEKIICSAIYSNNTLLVLENKKLTRFPVSVLNDPRLTEYWSQLTSLFLGGNRLVQIPAGFARLQSLQRLELNKNQLKTIPAELSNLQHLEFLALSHNHLNSLPIELGAIKGLRYLYLSNNHLSVEQLVPFMHQLGTEWFQRASSTQTPPTQTQRFRI